MRWLGQLALYVPLMALLGYFSTEPRFSAIGAGEALVRLSFVHAAERKHPCRIRSAEELSKLAPNMRSAEQCPRERAAVRVELEVDGRTVLRRDVPPAGLHGDGNAALYARLPVPAGRHRVVARLRDRADGPFNHQREETVELAPGQVLLIDFVAAKGGFAFRS
jgi:hypothetical protein